MTGGRCSAARAAIRTALAVVLALVTVLATAACTTGRTARGAGPRGSAPAATRPAGGGLGGSASGGPAFGGAVADLQQRALLLLMADQRRFEPFTAETALQGDAALRQELARSLGRAGDPRAVTYLGQLTADAEPEVVREAVFALGELELERTDAERAARALLLVVVEDDREAAALAVEALGKLGVSVTEVAATMARAELPEPERWARLLPALYRFDEDAMLPLAEAGLEAMGGGGAGGGGLSGTGLDPAVSLTGGEAGSVAGLRRRAAFALARDPKPASLTRLRELVADPDPRIRAWAARALGLIGAASDLPALRAVAAEDPASGPRIQAVRAAAGLAGRPGGEAGDRDAWWGTLTELLEHPDPLVRLEVLDRAGPWLDGGATGADAGAANGGALTTALLNRVRAAVEVAPEDLARRPTAAAAPGTVPPVPTGVDHAIRVVVAEGGAALTTLAASAPSLLTDADGVAVLRVAATSSDLLRAAAATALGSLPAPAPDALLPDEDAAGELGPLIASGRAAAGAATPSAGSAATDPFAADGSDPWQPLLAHLLADPAQAVRSAAAGGLLARAAATLPAPPAGSDPATDPAGTDPADETPTPPPIGPAADAARALALRLLGHVDPGVQAVAFGWLEEHPLVPYVDLTRALQRSLAGGGLDVRLAAVGALAARGEAEGRERGGVVTVLEKLAAPTASDDSTWLVARIAGEALGRLGRPVPPAGHPRGRRSPVVYEQIVQRTRRPRQVEVDTEAGTLTLRLDCPRAPMTCLNFLQLAGQGVFDGTPFHRVVPDFVVQGGDPRGDGSGGPGYAIRDEINRRRYVRGALGMALSGPDTGGSQFFVTHVTQPHLDGGYTAFGEVVAGIDVLDRITRGTRVLAVREVDR